MGRIAGFSPNRTFVAKMPVFLNSDARSKIQGKIRSLEALLAGRESANQADFTYTPFDRFNKSDIRKELLKLRQQLTNATPPDVNGKERDILLKRAQTLEKAIIKEMPTKDEMMGQRARNVNTGAMTARVETERAVQKEIHWRLTQNKNVHEWKQIMKTLNPSDPNTGNVERLRRGKSTAS